MNTVTIAAAIVIAAFAGEATAAEHCTVATDTYANTDPSTSPPGTAMQKAPAGLDARLAHASTIRLKVEMLE